MDEINAFFDFSKDFERVTVPRGAVSGTFAMGSTKSTDSKPIKREQLGREYSVAIAENEHRKLLEFEEEEDDGAHSSKYMELLDEDNSDEDVKPKINKIDDGVYDKYAFDTRRNESLPIHDSKEKIIETIRNHPVVVLEGDTGCGKTTQVPQYILDDAYRRREYCKICVTQPRRIAAISIANRVCDERKWPPGSVVGYKVGLHSNLSDDTRLVYCTTGVLLQNLIKVKSLNQYTHIILDEVHERDQDMDFLLIIVRRFLRLNSKNVKVILMSATINTGEFAEYFKIRNNLAPVLRVDTRRLFQVREYYLCDLDRINSANVDVDMSDPGISKEMYHLALKLVIVIDNIEKQEADNNADFVSQKTSILIFLPGINEIDQMCKKLEQLNLTESNNVKLYPLRLHSMISPDEQVKIFHRPPFPNYRKVILATNIAESSITVPDVKYVIDFCLTKSLITDTSTNFTSLQLHWASRANCRQRAGRAGRVMNGRVYRLVSKYSYENYLAEFCIPEMLRCPLETVVLKAKLLDLGSPPDILGLAMNPPNLTDIQNTILLLKEIGALFLTVDGTYVVNDGDLTFIGRVMAALPLDVRLSRLIILGYVFSAMEDTIIMAAGLSVRSILKFHSKSAQGELEAYIQKLVWADGSGSDLFAILKAYKLWASMREQNNMNEEESENAWAKRYFINLRSIREMHLLVLEIKERLLSFGLKEQTAYQRVHWIDREKTIILKIIIAGAFYPNYFTRSNLNDQERERGIYHTLCGNDPCTTVYYTNFSTRHIGQLYTGAVKELFRDVHIPKKNIKVRFQPGSERCFVSFEHNEDEETQSSDALVVPGRVCPEVYKAVRMRMLNIRPMIRVMDPRAAVKFAEERGLGVMCEGAWQPAKTQIKHPELVVLPNVFDKRIRGYVTHIETCSKFYFQPISERVRVAEIHSMLDDPEVRNCCRFSNASDVYRGVIVSAPFENKYHRAKVLKVIPATRQHVQFKVHFIDYGNTEIIDFEDLRHIPRQCSELLDIPPRVFKCRLAMVQPSSVKSPNGKWPDEAMELMQNATDGLVEMEIYSVVAGSANVIIKMGENTLNELLVDKSFARKSDENYMSKHDHDYRLRKQSVAARFLDEDHTKQNEEYLRTIQPDNDVEIDALPRELCLRQMNLRGPFSPLETKIFSAIRVGTWKTVHVERESVNSVLLDTDPQDFHERLIVAAAITESHNNDTLTARATTLMPNIHGFGALMTLLFCPTMQIKRNPNKTKFVAILAGLGYEENTGKPLYEEHDIVLNLDVDLLTDDLELINQLRYSMDTMLHTYADEERPSITADLRADMAAKIKNIIIRLLNKNRKYIETHIDANDNVWETYPADDIIESVQIYGHRAIFPMHSALRLCDEKFDRTHALMMHCQELHRLRQFDGSIQPLTCLLCNQPLENIVQLRIHLLSQLHRDREHQIRFKA